MTLVDLIRYIVKHYPYSEELSKARLNKIIYLIDWKSAIEDQKQITNTEWYYNHYGPYVDTIEKEINKDKRFKIYQTRNIYGNEKNIIQLEHDMNFQEPNEEEKTIIDFVILKTKKFNWQEFIKLVYSTYPIISQEKGTTLNLVKLAKVYNLLKKKDS